MADGGERQDKIQQFCAVTGAPEDFALTFLEDSGWNVEIGINSYMVMNALPRSIQFSHFRGTFACHVISKLHPPPHDLCFQAPCAHAPQKQLVVVVVNNTQKHKETKRQKA
jgi:hypothetical protein